MTDIVAGFSALIVHCMILWLTWVRDQGKSGRMILWKGIEMSNTGNWNTGYRNTGDWNTGDWNTGYRNTGDWNTGNWNTGYRNTGYRNTGYRNTGYRNTGNWNTGYRNTGNWNNSSYHAGCFNTIDASKAYYFNQLIDKSEWDECEKPDWIFAPSPTSWIYDHDMSDAEKMENPTFHTCGGYLRKNDMTDEWRKAFESATPEDIELTRKLPGFDADVFLEITGIDLRLPK
jgi:hypothetical protein